MSAEGAGAGGRGQGEGWGPRPQLQCHIASPFHPATASQQQIWPEVQELQNQHPPPLPVLRGDAALLRQDRECPRRAAGSERQSARSPPPGRGPGSRSPSACSWVPSTHPLPAPLSRVTHGSGWWVMLCPPLSPQPPGFRRAYSSPLYSDQQYACVKELLCKYGPRSGVPHLLASWRRTLVPTPAPQQPTGATPCSRPCGRASLWPTRSARKGRTTRKT